MTTSCLDYLNSGTSAETFSPVFVGNSDITPVGMCTPTRPRYQRIAEKNASLAEQKADRICRKAEAIQRFKKMGAWK